MSKLLKKQREDLGTDIKEVAASTRIKESCLRSIEDEDYEKLPIEVYTRGYIKEYAKYLGMPIEPAMAPYNKYLEMNPGARGKKADSIADQHGVSRQEGDGATSCKEVKIEPESSRRESRQQDEKTKRDRLIWKGVLLLLVVLAIIYQFVSSRNVEKEIRVVPQSSEGPVQNEPAIKPEAAVAPANEPAIKPEAPVASSNGPALKPEAPVAPSNGPMAREIKILEPKKHLLELAATDKTWVWILMDGTKKREALMKPGDTATYEANNTFSMIIGNAGGVRVKFDGKELPAGKTGEVLKLTLPEKKNLAPQSESSEHSLKKNPNPSVPGRLDGADQAPKDNAPSSASHEKLTGTSHP